MPIFIGAITSVIFFQCGLFEDSIQYSEIYQIIFQSEVNGNKDIYQINSDGTDLRQLTFDLGIDADPQWSPEGNKFVFTSNRNGNWDIYIYDLNTENITQLSTFTANDVEPDWSPDGNQIVFQSDRSGNNDIYLIDIETHETVQLTENTFADLYPVWSPEGSQIAFISYRDGNAELYIMNAIESGNKIRLTHSDRMELEPTWSPDGSHLAFSTHRGNDEDIYTIKTDGSDTKRLSQTPSDEWCPVWSTDGELVFYFTYFDRKIYKANSDGIESDIFGKFEETALDLSISNNGKILIFSSDYHGPSDLFMAETETGKLTRITNSFNIIRYPKIRPNMVNSID